MNNRVYNSANPHQGDFKKVLCVCSAGLLRSPTAAVVLSQEPYNYNTRAVGLESSFALIPIDDVLISWADEIVCMTNEHMNAINTRYNITHCSVINLNILDDYDYRDSELINLIKENYEKETK